MDNIKVGDKIIYCFTMEGDENEGVIVKGTVFDVREKSYGFVCEECFLDNSGNGIYKYLCKCKDKEYGSKKYCYKIEQDKTGDKIKVLEKALDIALVSYASSCACDACEEDVCKNQCIEDVRKDIISQAEKKIKEDLDGK